MEGTAGVCSVTSVIDFMRALRTAETRLILLRQFQLAVSRGQICKRLIILHKIALMSF